MHVSVAVNALNYNKKTTTLFYSLIQNEIHPPCCLRPWDGCVCPCKEIPSLPKYFIYEIILS